MASGLVLGVLAAMARLPYFPTTAVAQTMAAVGQTPEWSRAAAYGRPAPGLARALAAAPADAALHIGAASWELYAAEVAETAEPAWCGNSYRHDTFQARGLSYRNVEARSPPSGTNDAKRALARLYALGRRFPNDPSVRAYQLRRLLRGPVWIPRAGALTPPEKPPPPLQLLEQFDAIARAGQRLQPANGFFHAMRVVAAFAGNRDDAGLRHLHTAATMRSWNDQATDETRAVWKLLRAAYGDRGVEQLLPSEQAVALPHFATLRAVARVAVRHAAAFDRAGDHARAQEIRGDVMRLGLLLEDQSPLVIGKQIGDALFYLGMAPATPKAVSRKSPWSGSERRQRRERYMTYLKAHGGTAEAAWVRSEGQRVDALHGRIRRAWDALSDRTPDWPPRGLAVWWEFGVVLVQQIAVVVALWGGVLLLTLWVDRKKSRAASPAAGTWLRAGPMREGPWTAAHLFLLLAPLGTSMALEGIATQFWQESILAGIAMTGLLAIARCAGKLRQRRTGPALPSHEESHGSWISTLIALVSIVLPIALLMPYWSFISHTTQGGSIFGLPGWGPPLGLTLPEVAFLPAMLLCCFALCRGAVLGLPVAAGLCREVRLAAPYAVALATLLYLAGSVATSRANAKATRQLEWALTKPLAAMEATDYRSLAHSAVELRRRPDWRWIEQRAAVTPQAASTGRGSAPGGATSGGGRS